MVTQDEIRNLIQNCLNVGINIKISNLQELQNKGYTVLYGGDSKFLKLEDIEENFTIKQFDRETWVIMEYKKVLTSDEWKDINSKAIYNGGTQDEIDKDIKDGELNPIKESICEADIIKLKDINKEKLIAIWCETDLDEKQKLIEKVLDNIEHTSLFKNTLLESVKSAKRNNEIDILISQILLK